MRKRKHPGFRSRKGPKRKKLYTGQKKDLTSNSKNIYEPNNREKEEKATLSYSSSSEEEEENPLKQLVTDLRKDSNQNQNDELSDESIEDNSEEIDEAEEDEKESGSEGEGEVIDSEKEGEGEVIDSEEQEEEEEIDDEGQEEEEEIDGEEQEEEEEEIDGEEEEEEIDVEEEEEEIDGEEEEDEIDGEEQQEEEEEVVDGEEGEEEGDENLEEDFGEVEETFASSSEEDSGPESEDDDNVPISPEKDPFLVHYESVIPDKYVEKLDGNKGWQKEQVVLPFGKCVRIWNADNFKAEVLKSPENNLQELHVRQKLINHLPKTNTTDDVEKSSPAIQPQFFIELHRRSGAFSPFQNQLFQVLNSYQDFYYPQKTLDQSQDVEMVYCLHVINHVLKSRTRVLNHDIKLKAIEDKGGTEEFLDQGLTRPKVLIIVPFRETAKRLISNFIKLLGSAETQTDSKKRFFNEFSLQEEEVINEKKPEDYKRMFAGNTDDHFRIGLSLSRRRFKLYTKFYSSDIIIASPLGLRTVIGAEHDIKKDYDFLSSIEILILDQTDIFLMQNWDHLMQVMNQLHLQPKESHGCDFSRIRPWSLNGWSKYYRQTVILSSLFSPPITLLFNKYCSNYAGKLQVHPAPISGSICQVALQLPLVFHKIESTSYAKLADDRFNMFMKKILPKFQDNAAMRSTMVFIPSYFDFVRIRNHFDRKEIKFLQINEYSDVSEVSRTRSQFFLGKTPFLLYTERRHFYFRPRVRGVQHIIFYELPLYSHFFSEVCNMMYDAKSKKGSKTDVTGTILYSKYDAQRLAGVVGTDRAALMINSPKPLHMFITDS